MPKKKASSASSRTSSDRLLQGALRVQSSVDSSTMSMSDWTTPRVPLLYLDPLFDQILMIFPQDNLRELYRRLRHYYKYEPNIRNIIDLHTESPLSDFELRCPEHPEAQDYYNDFKDRKRLVNVCINLMRDYWMLGEAFYYGNWDAENQEFSDFVQLPPEEVEVHSAYVSSDRVYLLRPNREINTLMRSANMADRLVAEAIRKHTPKQAQQMLKNKPTVLDTNRLVVMQREISGYSNRGVSPLLSVVKDLMFQDFLNLFRSVFIQRHSYPLRVFKIGSEAKGFLPDRRMLNEFRQELIKAANDQNYNIVTHPFVNIDSWTGHDKILPLIPYYDLVKQRIFTGLFVSESIVSGEKTPYASGVNFMRGLMNRYLTNRVNLENELKRKIFLPLALKRGYKDSKGRPILPEFFWTKANLLSSQSIQQFLINLREKGEIPFRFIAEMFGYKLSDIEHQFKAEAGTRTDPLWRKIVDSIVMKYPDIQEAYLQGKDITDAIKEKVRQEVRGKKPREEAPEAGSKGMPKVPTVSPKRTPVPPAEKKPAPAVEETTGTPPPPPAKPQGVPSVPGEERRPRPGETSEGGGGGGTT